MAAKNRWEAYQEEKAAKQTTGQQDSGQQSQTKKNRLEEYREKRGSNSENIYAVASSITERVNTWLQNHNNYIKNYQTRNSGRKYSYEDSYVSDSGSWLDTVSKQKSAFDVEADSILAYMDQYNGYLDADWMKSVRDTLTSARGQQNIVLENTTKDNEWWNSFGSDQELVGQFGSAEGVYNYFQRTDGYNKKYTGMGGDDILKAITTLQEGEERDWLLYNQDDIVGNTIRSNADFQKYASQGAALDYTDFGTEEWHKGKSRRQRGYNSIDKYRAASLALSEHYGNEAPLGSHGQYDEQVAIYRTMEDEEFETLAYCIAYDKEHGTNLAEQYVDRIEMTLTNRRGTNIANKIKDIPVVADLYAIPAGLDQFATGLENMIYDKDYYIPSEIQVASGEIRESFADDGFKLPEWMGGGSARQGLYDLGTTTANMAPSILASAAANALLPGSGAIVGNTLMGTSAAGNAYADAVNRGFGKDEAKFYAGAIGASEAVLGAALGGISKLGGVSPALTKAVSGIDSGLARFALQYGGKLVSEGVEEGLQEILDPILQNAILRADEDIDWSQVAYSAMLGAMSAGVLETRVTINETRAETALNKQAVKQYGESTDALIQEGLESDVDSESYKLAQKYQQQVQGKDGQNGKALTGYQIRNLLAANQEQIAPKDIKLIQQAAEKRLTELGQTEDVTKVAELATKYATGQKLTKAEKNFLSSSKYGSRVYNELLPKNIMSGDFSTEWAEEIGTKQVNRGAYNKKALVQKIVEAMTKVEDPNAYKSLESRVEAAEPAKVSDTGKAVIRATDEEIDLASPTFKQISDDGVTLEVNGKAVNANDIDYESESQGLAINAISKIEHITPAAATALYAKLDMTKPVMEQLNGMDEAFSYGYYNYSEADLEAGAFAGSLTQEQKTDAYKLGQYVAKNTTTDNAAAIKMMRTAADAAVEKAKAEGQEAPKGKKLSITYNHGGGVVEDISTAKKKLGKLTDEQLGGMEAAEILHQMGIGTDFELFTSYNSKTLKDKNGKPLEVFLNDEGQEQAAYAGVYMAANGKIRINLNAYSGTKGLTLNALSHELTHFIKAWSPEKYKAMAEFLVKSYGEKGVSMHKLVLKEQSRLESIRGEEVSYSEAYDEVVANAFNRMLEDGKVMDRIAEIRQVDKSLGDKIIECIRNFIKRFFKVYQDNQSLFMETEALMEMKEVFEQLQDMFAEALVDASDNFQASLIAKEAGLDVMPVEASTQYSYQSLAEAAGFNAVENEDGTRSFVRDGKKVNEVTVEDIDNSPIGAFINFSVEMKDISEADAKRQKEMFAKLCTMACKTNDFAMTMQFVGSAVFTGMKANADKQYGTTYDFPSICTKTQAVIDAMSAKMMALGRGLNTDEIVKLYDDVFASGNPVPCPECYVFSRWIGIGGLLDNIKKYQDYYGDMDVKDVAAAYLKMKAEVSKFADEQGISFGKAKGALTAKLTKEYNKLTEKIEKAENQGEKVKPADRQRLAELEPMMNTVKSMTWLENVYFADSTLKKVNPRFRVPNDVLFDLNNGEAFATQYKEAWAFRTTQGAGYGKAITPYAEARLGEGVLVTNNTTNAIKGRAQGTLDNYFLQQMGKLDKKSREALKKARIKQKIQAFIGGQRFQSTSDARYENASDYLLAALEMQAMGGMVQCYTKVDGAVPAFSAWGFSINQSLMPLNGGLDADGNVQDTAVGGMKPSVAFENRKKHETAGTITIGVNDNHIRAMFKQWVRDFIIPYHASGGKATVVAEFRRIQEGKETKGESVRSTDYSRTQSDKILSDEVLRWQGKTDAQIQRIHEIRDARIAILTGGKVNMTVVRSNRFLSALYDKLNGGEWDGVKLAKSKVESQIYPNEFWDQTVSYDESAKITKDYLEYCEDLGFLHRFSGMIPSNGKLVPASGYNENGERVQLTDLAYKYDENGNKTDAVEEFFWKVLTDRRMYDNNGNYLPQKVVTLNDTTAETVTGFAKNNQGRQYDKAKAEALAKKIAGTQYSSQETDLDLTQSDLYPATKREREVFNRRFIDETNGLKPGDTRDIMFNTGVRIYFIRAYGTKGHNPFVGEFLTSVDMDDASGLYEIAREEFKNAANGSTKGNHLSDEITQVDGSGGSWRNPSIKERLEAEGLGHLLEEESDSYTERDRGQSGGDRQSREITSQIDEKFFEFQSLIPGFSASEVNVGSALVNMFRDYIMRGENANSYGDFMAKEDIPKAQEIIRELDALSRNKDGAVYSSQETDLGNAPVFYSQMGKVVEGMKQEKFGASSVISMLTGRGVKAEEIRWSGIQAFLDGKKSVTKAELLDFIKGSMLQIEELLLDNADTGERSKLPDNYRLEETEDDFGDPLLNLYIDGELRDTFRLAADDSIESTGNSNIWAFSEEDLTGQILNYYAGMGYDEAYLGKRQSTKYHEFKLDGGTNYRELLFKMPDTDYTNQAMSVHWGNENPGVLAHARMQDFEVDGKKMLFIEEIQSDWHNEGHKTGYSDELDYEQLAKLKDQVEIARSAISDAYVELKRVEGEFHSLIQNFDMITNDNKNWQQLTKAAQEKLAKASLVHDHARHEYVELQKKLGKLNGKVPDAPFRNNYHEYVLKRLLRMAAEEGYDSIGWTTADIQSDRWSDDYAEGYRIEYDQDIPKFLKKYGKQWGAEVGKTPLPGLNSKETYYDVNREETFDSFAVWQDTVRDTIRDQGGDVRKVLFWMDGKDWIAYDKDTGHELDRTRVSKTSDKVWSMDITPAMKKSVLTEGQAMYSSQETDADYIRYDRRAILKESKVDEYLYDYAAKSSPKYAQAYIAYVRPRTFLKLTTDDVFERYHIADQAGELDEERLSNSRPGIYLRMDHETGQVTGHEGRHRMAAMDSAGIELVPVLLLDNSNKMTKTDIAEITLHGQFDETAMGIVKDLIPLNYENRDRVIKNFATQSSTQRIGERYGLNKTLRFSTQQTDNITNRHLLANAFEMAVQNSSEYEMLQEYKDHIAELNSLEAKLSDFNQQIRKIRFQKGEFDAEKLARLEGEAKKIAEAINKHDKRLLSMEASEPLRKVIARERAKASQKAKDHVKQIQQNKKVRAEQTELRHKIRKAIRDLDKILNRGNKKQNVKEDMQDFVSKALELADYIFTDHVSNDELIRKGITVRMTPKEAALVHETEEILSKLYDNADSLSDDEFTRLDAKRKANEEKLRDLLTAQRNERLNTPVSKLFDDLVNAYASLKNSKQDAVKAAYNEELEKSLRAFMGDEDRVKILSNMRVADMTTEELNWLYRAYTMVLTNVRKANEFHVKGMNETIDQMAGRIANDFSSRKIPDKKLAIAVQKLVNKMGWDYEKLYYALDRIGSEAFAELIMNIADSENTVMQDIMEAAVFRDQMVEKYGYNNWAVNKEIDREFLDNTGKKFKLTLGQLMALYAYSRREGALDHLEYGGFMFGEAALTNPRPADTYKINKAQCDAITSLLTAEQKAYAEDMQKFLSETMGEKGNEVSMLLYGIKMFGEKNYFPIHVAGQFKAQAQESQAKAAAGFSSMSNAGFTHEQNRKAKAPIVLEGFNEIWTDHVNEMSRYHGTVPALEDLRRVMNRSAYSDSMSDSTSIAQLMENSYGKEARAYFDNLYREANSGAITDKLQHTSKKLLSLFRKNSVAYSLSVLIQQPASLVRAYAMIDRKYFGFKGFGAITSGVAKAVSSKWNSAYADAYNEMLKYAPGVTMAKEIGGFDTATGGSIRSYLLDTGKSFKQAMKTGTNAEKAGAVMGVVDDNAIANLPNVADKIAWIEIWNACKRETVAKHKDLTPGSDAFLEAVGERFTEVIRATQVYDSIFAKSPMLKSKNLAVQYLVSFMNEPNTVANMVEKAVRDVTTGDVKQGVRTAAVVVHSIIFTNVLKSLIYAMRDDDEDESYIEKYLEAVVGNMMNDFNALNYIPLARDVVSLAQGYDVERADMAIVADAIDAVEKVIKYKTTDTEGMTEEQLIELDKKQIDANWKLAESIASFFGIPVKNIRREINGVLDHARIAKANAGQTTKKSISDKVYDAVVESIPFMSSNKKSKTDKLYEAIMSGDQAYLGRLKSGYKDDDAYHSAVRKVLRENDTRIHAAAQAKYEGNSTEYKRIFREIQNEGKFSFDDIMEAINSELSAIKKEIEPKSETSDYSSTDFINAILVGETGVAEAMREDIISYKVANGKTQREAEESFADSVTTGTKNAYYDGLLDEAGVAEILTAYADMDDEEADGKVNYWAFCKAHPQYNLSQTNVEDYWEFGEPAEIPLDIFVQYINGTKGLATIYDEYGDEVESKRDQVLAVIDSLDLTWQQKDALYLAARYAESKIWDVPW